MYDRKILQRLHRLVTIDRLMKFSYLEIMALKVQD